MTEDAARPIAFPGERPAGPGERRFDGGGDRGGNLPNSTHDAAYWIRALGLRPHPEGGYFAETYRSAESVPRAALPERYDGDRPFSTAIHFLLSADQVSMFHRLRSDEIWHFHAGSAAVVHVIEPDGTLVQHRLGPEPGNGDRFQVVVPAGRWFGATVDDPESFVLVGCTVAPGFSYDDFELGDRSTLVAAYPRHRALIERLTRPPMEAGAGR